MNYTLRSMTDQERLYAYTQSSQIGSMTGNIGHLRAYYESDGTTFCSTWFDFRKDIKTQEFMEELDDVIGHYLLDEESGEDFLFSRSKLSKFCFSHPEAAGQDLQAFFFRADTENYSYLLRLNPNRGEYCMYCYCYRRDWLDHHLQEARRGIRFIDSDYQELFRLKDGGKIRVRFRDGTTEEKTCRYIDPTHFEYGTGALSVFHTSQFAEWMAGTDAVFEPVNEADIVQIPQRKYDRGR